MNTLKTTAYAVAIVIATLSLASCDKRSGGNASAPSSGASAPSSAASPASR